MDNAVKNSGRVEKQADHLRNGIFDKQCFCGSLIHGQYPLKNGAGQRLCNAGLLRRGMTPRRVYFIHRFCLQSFLL